MGELFPLLTVAIAWIALVLLPVYLVFEIYNLARRQTKAKIKARVLDAITAEADGAAGIARRLSAALRAAAGPVVQQGAEDALRVELDLIAVQSMGRPQLLEELGPLLITDRDLDELDAVARKRLRDLADGWVSGSSPVAGEVTASYLADMTRGKSGLDSTLLRMRFERFFAHKKDEVRVLLDGALSSGWGRAAG